MPIYQSGAPQVADVDKWLVGIAGGPPNTQGWSQDVVKTYGINNDESIANALVANEAGIAEWANIVAAGTLGDTKIAVNPVSTGEKAVEECLKKYNVSFDPATNFVYDSSNQWVLDQLSAPNGTNFGGLWAPSLYSAIKEFGKESMVCNGKEAGVQIVGGIMVNNDAEGDMSQFELAAKGIAAHLKGITYFKDPVYRDQAKAYLNEFYVENGFEALSPEALDIEFSRPLYNLVEQQQMLAKNEEGVSILGTIFQGTVDFMVEGGTLSTTLNAEDYLPETIMNWIASDMTLNMWTMTTEESAPVSSDPPAPVPDATEAPAPVPDATDAPAPVPVDTADPPTPDSPPTESIPASDPTSPPSSGSLAALAVHFGVGIFVLNYMFM